MRARIVCSEREDLSGGLTSLEGNIKNIDFDFALVAFPPDYDPGSVAEGLTEILSGKNFVAFSSILTLYEGNLCSDRFIALLIKFENEGDVEILCIEDLTEKEPIVEIFDFLSDKGESFNFVLAGYNNGYTSNFIENLGRTARKKRISISLIGGIPGDDIGRESYRTYQIVNGKVIENGLVVVSFKGVEYSLSVSFGFKAIGPEYKVVESVGNIVKRIDEESAYYLFERIVSQLPVNDLSSLIYTPIILTSEKDGLVDIARTPRKFIFTPGYKGVEFFGPIREGSHFKFSFGNGHFLLEELRENIASLNRDFPDTELFLAVECLGRTKILQEDIDKEKELYNSMIKAPIFGFYSLGEVAPNKFFNTVKFYNEVNLLIALREK